MTSDLHGRTRTGRTSPALVVALGAGFDVAARGRVPNLAHALFFIVTAGVLAATVPGRIRRGTLGAAGLVAVFFALHSSGPVAALDALAVVGMLGAAASNELGDLMKVSVGGVVTAVFAMIGSALAAPAMILRPYGRTLARFRERRAGAIARGLLIVVPIVLVFAALLAAADRVFARLIVPGLPHIAFASVAGHVALIGLGAWGVGTLLQATMSPALPHEAAPARRNVLTRGEWLAALGGIDVLFAIFVGVQFAFLFGGHHRVDVTPGLTYAEYARSGFFQLLAVASLTEIVILGAWDLGTRSAVRDERAFRILVAVMVALSFVIIVSAFKRLAVYEEAFGFTTSRLIASAAVLWIGAVMVTTLVFIVTGRRRRLISACLVLLLAGLLVLNALNPDAFIAARNVDRFRATGKLDVSYLGRSLGPDAIPSAVDVLGALTGEERSELLTALCVARRDLEPRHPWDRNLGRERARASFDRAIPAEVCARILS